MKMLQPNEQILVNKTLTKLGCIPADFDSITFLGLRTYRKGGKEIHSVKIALSIGQYNWIAQYLIGSDYARFFIVLSKGKRRSYPIHLGKLKRFIKKLKQPRHE